MYRAARGNGERERPPSDGSPEVSHLPGLVVRHRLANLRCAVHDERPAPNNGLGDRLAAEQERRCVFRAVDGCALRRTVEESHFCCLDCLGAVHAHRAPEDHERRSVAIAPLDPSVGRSRVEGPTRESA